MISKFFRLNYYYYYIYSKKGHLLGPWPFFERRLSEVALSRSLILVHEYHYAVILKIEEEEKEVYNESRRNKKKKLLM